MLLAGVLFCGPVKETTFPCRLLNDERYLRLVQNRSLPGGDAESFGIIKDAVYDLWSGPSGLDLAVAKALLAVRRILDSMTNCGAKWPVAASRLSSRSSPSSSTTLWIVTRSTCRGAEKRCQVYPQPDGKLMPACVYNCLRR